MPPLTPQQVEVRLGKLDVKSSDKLAVPGTLAVAQNVEMEHTGRLQRRHGSSFWDLLAGAERIHAGEREFLAATADVLYADIDGALSARGNVSTLRADFRPINTSPFEQTNHDHIRAAGLEWHVWQEASGIYYAVRDLDTGAYIVVDGVIATAANVTRPRLVAVTGYVVCLYVSGANTLFAKRISTSTPATVGAPQTIESTLSYGSFDVIATTGTVIAVASDAGGPALRLRTWDVATQLSVALLTGAFIANTTRYCVSFVDAYDAVNGYRIAFAVSYTLTTAGDLRYATAPTNLSAFTVSVIHTGASDTDWYSITGWRDSVSGLVHIVAEFELDATSSRERLVYLTRTSGGVVSSPLTWQGFRLASRPFVWRGRTMFLASNESGSIATTLVATAFVVEILSGALIGRALPAVARGKFPNHGWLGNVTVDANVVYIPATYRLTGTQFAAALVRLRVPLPARYLEIAGCTLIPGSTIHLYDGIGVSELGFHNPPVKTADTTIAGTLNGTFWYRAIWSWVDADGRLHRSEPCDAFSRVLAAQNARLTFNTLTATLKSKPVQQAALQVYRSVANPSAGGAAAMYLCATVSNSPASVTIQLDDAMTDATLITKERLYTLGNTVLPDTTPPPANGLCVWGERVWAWERDVMHFSKTVRDDYGVSFSDEQYVEISDERGDIIVAAGAGPRIAIFKSTGIYVISGDGPNDVGAGAFPPVRRLAFPLGARSQMACVATELGVFFQDDASGHIWLLPPEGNPEPVGKDIEEISTALTITDAIVVPDRREVRFMSSTGTTLIFDMTHQTWRTATEQPTLSATLASGLVRYLTPDGEIRQEDTTKFTEGAAGVIVPDVDPMVFTKTLGTPTVIVSTVFSTPLPACTAAGLGVGKTLTATANGALAGVSAGQVVLVAGQVDPLSNGVYTVTAAGNAGAPFVLTRATTFDQVGETLPGTLVGVTGSAVAWRLNDGWPYHAAIETTWLSLSSVGGYQRTYVAQATGVKRSEHVMRCSLGYRFGSEETTREVNTTALDNTRHGYRIEARPELKHQQATALKVRFEDDAPHGPGWGIDAITLTVGLRGNRARLPRAHTMQEES